MGDIKQSEVLLHRSEILKQIERTRSGLETVLSAVAPVAQSFAEAKKDEHLDVTMGLIECIDMCLELNEDLFNFMTAGMKCYEDPRITNKYRDARTLDQRDETDKKGTVVKWD